MADPSDPRIGLVIQNRYRIEERLGAGGMGVVYLAERIGLGRRVAIKFLHADIAAQPQFRIRFEREARAMSKLNHPHCVPVIDYGVADAPYIVLEYVTGESLAHLLARGPIPLRRALAITRQILAGLAHAHNEGIVHRDIKPDNVILAEATGTGDHARLLDFGLAKVAKRAGTASGLLGATAMGTPSYMSPEQARGEDVDARSDLYSCGVMLFQMLTGKRPFTGSDPLDVLRAHVEDSPPRLADVAPEMKFPAALETVMAGALAKNPDARYATAIDFSEALRTVQELPGVDESNAVIEATKPRRDEQAERPAPPPPPVAATEMVAPPPKKKRGFFDTLFWIIVLVVIGVVAGGAWWLQRDLERLETEPPPAPAPGPGPDVSAWRADHQTFAAELPARHMDLFVQASEADFRREVDALDARLPTLRRSQVIVGIMRLAAMIGDGHTTTWLQGFGSSLRFPLVLRWFPEGFHVIAAPPEHAWAIGRELVAIGGVPIDQALERVTPAVSHDNQGQLRGQLADALTHPLVLDGVDLADPSGKAVYRLEARDGGDARDLELAPANWRPKADTSPDAPPGRRNRHLHYWNDYLAEKRLVYFQYNVCKDAPDRPFADFAASTLAFIDQNPVDTVVIDLRTNGGGDSRIAGPLIRGLAEREVKVYVLIGRHTFSSALLNAMELDAIGATLVGEPTGGRPSHYGEVKHFDLPALGMKVQYSTKFFDRPQYAGDALEPELAVDVTAADYFAGKDPELDAIFAAAGARR